VEAICGVERPSTPSAERRVQKEDKIALECFCLIACEELSSKKAENDVVVFFRYPYRWVSQWWR